MRLACAGVGWPLFPSPIFAAAAQNCLLGLDAAPAPGATTAHAPNARTAAMRTQSLRMSCLAFLSRLTGGEIPEPTEW
jgi:hypothetical protein